MGPQPPRDPRDGDSPADKVTGFLLNLIDKPATWFREDVADASRKTNKQYYYHRRFRRVPTIDECYTDDKLCEWEADEQYKRDKRVDESIVQILRSRRIECEMFHGNDARKKCEKVREDYYQAAGNYFEKYGDLGPASRAKDAYMKQKHKMIWERRHGKVGSGMKKDPNSLD